ncbi:DUF637 domain-containing protein [Pseudomonas putida]|uniref:two-partner secretion domain-containing protein n=1 Tax=Pseudomonas putida TaxID=303 RepID=UPI0018AB04B7|nr:DUF637 domain-containing protein [Pseudomonas putida]MBF8725799.1 DUF637 domain-containing protein [Pseudomonas putida]
MDVRQLTLAAQPTAVLADRPNFLGLPKRLLAVLLANVMFWQPIWAMADGIAVSGTTNTQVGKAGNGVPVVNIAAPNAAGLSHNQYERYNVDSQGLILNNSTQAIQGTQLGGNILGNQQLGGHAASTILNEVNGANATQLKGYTEVAGQAARVIVANPHGVTCNGCGFINTPRVTLSTGKPVLDATGKLDHFAVDGGSISIEGQGLDASNIDQFDLITRSAKLNADLYAKRLNVVAGANDVNADTLATTPRQGDPADKPQLAIDSSALGGMYADTIKLVGTEQGVGVKTAGNLAASAGDIQIDANGQLNMAQASAKGALNVTAPVIEMTGKAYANSVNVRTPGKLVSRQSLAARERVEIDAGTLSNPGTVAAGIENDNSRNAIGDVTVRAASLDNTGTLQASRNLTVEASQRIDNRGVLQAQRTQLTTATLSNQGKAARVVGEQALFVAAPAIVNLGGVLLFGNGQDVTLDLARLDNREGLLQAVNGKLTLNVATLDNAAGQIDAKTLNVSSDTLDNRAGLLSASGGDAQVIARMRLDNRDGTVQAQRHLNASTGQADNQGGRLLAVTGDLDLATTGLDNRNGSLLGTGIRVTAPQADIDNRQGKIIGERLDLDVAQLDNRQGQIVGEQLAITAKRLDNRDQGLLAAGTQGLTLDFARSATQAQLLNDGGRVQSDASLLLRGAWLDNSGGTVIGSSLSLDTQRLYNDAKGALVSDGGDVQLSVSDVLSNLTGIIDAGQHGVTLDGAAAVDNSGGSLRGQRLDLHANTLNNGQGGQLVAGSDGLRYTGGTLNNDAGIVLATAGTTALQLGQAALSNLGGIIQGDSVEITAARLDNGSQSGKAGSIASLVGGLTLNAATLANAGGTLFAKTALRSIGTILSNTQGGQISGETLDLKASQVDNYGGLIEANSRFTLSARALDNRDGQLTALGHSLVGLTAASDLSRLELTGSLLNQNGRIAAGNTDFSLKAALLDNRGGRIEHAGDGLLSLVFDRVSGVGGRITALGAGDWQFGQVDGLGSVQLNRALTYTSDALALQTGDRLASASNLTLNLARLDNGGELLSDGDLTLNLSGDLNNRGRLSAQGLVAINAGNVTQNGGRIGAGTDARLSLTGNLDNLGYLTARQALAIDATQILNRGTLGAQGAVTLNAERISNDPDTLLFSGGAMALRTQVFSNLYGDVYSRGDLSVANRDGNAAQRFSNLSGTVESEGAITLNAASVENAKASFELGESIVSGSLSWVCGQHCGGHDSFKRGTITIEQTLLERATQDSPGARLVAGKDLTIQASDVQNRYSLLAANGNLSITANDLLNLGATERTGQQKIVIGTPGRIDTGYWDQMEYIDVPAFNAAVAAGDFDLARFELLKARSADARFSEESNVTTWSDSFKPLYAATLQAGGTVNLNVARSVQNGSVSEHNALEILTGKLRDDQTGVPVGGIDITLNKQAVDASAATVAALPSVQRVTDANGQTTIVPVDYSGIPFAAVDPTAGPTFQLPQGDYGLFVRNPDPNGHYLIETNPNFTDLSRFLGSDYLLERLDIGPDANWRRLGDGLYEQRLIRDAVLAQTGQRFLADGLVSDYDQYRYLMDNALASKDALNLSLGVALTSAQVGALTHDIVWMENRVVDGQTVLVPTLYLAQVDARNVRGSSLIQGRDLSLISGGDLVNVGTLRASRDLSVSSGGSIYQGGLVEAGNNLQLIAQDSIRNAMAGQIRGENVSLAAVRGDVTNERTAIQVRDGAGYRTVTDAGSGVSARQDLAVSAGRDVTNYGTLQAGRDVALQAGNDVNLLAKTDGSEKHEIFKGGHRYVVTTQGKQLSSTVDAGRDLDIQAGRDINVLASQANAGQDLRLGAGQDINVTSAAEVHNVETRIRDGKKRITEANDQSTQLASALTAGRDLRTEAGRDTTLVASKISAGNEAYLVSGNQLSLVAAQDSTHTLHDMKEKGNWGAKKAQRDEVTQTTQVGTDIRTGGKLTLRSGGDQLYQVAKLNSGNDLNLQSGGAITFEGVKDLHDESHTKSKSNLAWFSMKGKGNTDETLRQSELLAQGQTVIQAVQGLKIDVKHVDQQTVSQTIDAMVDAEPQLAWLKEAEQRGDVDWRQVKELHESFKYDNSGMGQAAMLAVIIIVTVVTAGGASALAASAGSAVGAGSTMAAASAATATTAATSAGLGNIMATAALTSMASTGAVSFINNKGNLSLAAKDTLSGNSLKNATIGALTAGLINYADSTWFQGASPAEGAGAQVTTAGPVQNPGYSEQWLNWNKAQDALARSGTHAVIESGVSTAINGGSLKDNLGTAVVSQGFDLAAAMGNKQLGDFANYLDLSPGSAEKIFLHAMLGGALSAARGGDFKTGALAAGAAEGLTGVASENLGKYIDTRFMTDEQFRVATAQIIGIAAGSLVDGNPNNSAWVAGNVERYNEQMHRETVEKIEQESGRYAQENQISRPEAEKRLAQAAQYYSDADWRAVMLKNGYVPDETALDYLGEILAPTGSYYAERQTPKGVSLEPGRRYTAQETAALLRDFEFNNPGAFSDTSINAENFVGVAHGDLGNSYKRFYERTLKVDSSWSDWSLGNAVGATQGMSASVRGLQNTVSGIANDPVGAFEQFANGVGFFARYPLTTIGNGWDSLVEKGGLSQAYALQGRHELAGAVAAEQLTDFGIGLIPGERLLALGKVGGATNALDGLVWHDAALGAKATTNAPNTPRFITDSAGNTIDLDYTKGLRETNVTVTGTRGGVQYPLQGQTPDSYANLGNGHVVVYGPEGRALYDVSSSRIKVVEWNQAPDGTYFPKKGSDTKAFEGNVPQPVLDSLGLK